MMAWFIYGPIINLCTLIKFYKSSQLYETVSLRAGPKGGQEEPSPGSHVKKAKLVVVESPYKHFHKNNSIFQPRDAPHTRLNNSSNNILESHFIKRRSFTKITVFFNQKLKWNKRVLSNDILWIINQCHILWSFLKKWVTKAELKWWGIQYHTESSLG